jgi:hypothetical protein
VQARGLEFVADESEAKHHDPEVVLGGGRIEVAALARGGLGGERVGREGEHQLDVGLHLARVSVPLKYRNSIVPRKKRLLRFRPW